MKFSGLIVSLILLAFSAHSGEVLFSDDFSSGELESNWILYGDPLPGIMDSLGIPPPCFINNGDAMWGSGVFSRDSYNIDEGLSVKCDIYLECQERGTWVSACLRLVTPEFRDERTLNDHTIVLINLAYLGELNWQLPHLQFELNFGVYDDPEADIFFRHKLYHQNHLLNRWHNYKLVINEDRYVSLYIDDNFLISAPEPIPDSIDNVRVMLGDRSSEWGVALHDNLVVYRP